MKLRISISFGGLLLASAVLAHTSTPAQQNKLLTEIGFTQKLDAPLPLDLEFQDEAGKAVPLNRYFGATPVILALVYYECPMLCTETLNGLTQAMQSLPFDAGQAYRVVTVSIDPKETPALAAAKKQSYLQRYGRPGAAEGWAFLTGKEPAIRRLADAAGFHYAYDPDLKQYAHPAGILVITPQGRISKYLYGISFSPRDLRLALVNASAGRIGSPADRLILYCYHYDPLTGRYNLAITRLMQTAGLATILAIVLLLYALTRAGRKKGHP